LQIGDDYNIDVDLPRAALGGLKKGPVEDLLRVIARDYAKLEAENDRLLQSLQHLEAVTVEADPAADDAPPAPEPTISALSSSIIFEERNGRGDEAVSIDPQEAAVPVAQPPLKDRNDFAAEVLAMAQRAARDLREATRDECEQILRKTRSHARKLERELEQTRAVTSAELEELRALKHEMREHMRSSLQALLRTFVDERAEEMPAFDWTDASGFVLYAENDVTAHRKKNKKSRS
jgi:cell division septum initiation protein DivIVA